MPKRLAYNQGLVSEQSSLAMAASEPFDFGVYYLKSVNRLGILVVLKPMKLGVQNGFCSSYLCSG